MMNGSGAFKGFMVLVSLLVVVAGAAYLATVKQDPVQHPVQYGIIVGAACLAIYLTAENS